MSARRPRHRARRAGFTLVEMMVAMTIGALVIVSVYTLGGSAARDFQEQQRITQLQLSTRLALDRVRRDVERAGLHGTPDSQSERLGVMVPQRIVAVAITDNEAGSRAAINAHQAGGANAASTQADRLTLTGNFVTSDAYLVRSLNSTGNTAFLQTSWQGFRRSFVTDAAGTIDEVVFQDVFRTGRMLHIQTQAGSHFFVRVLSTNVTPGSASVTFSPGIGVGGTALGGLGEGSLIAPISGVQYALEANPADLPAVSSSSGAVVTGPNVGLVRREIDITNGAVLASRTVLEWAVHFDVDAILDPRLPGSLPNATQLVRADDGQVTAQVAAQPGRVRALVVTVGARSRDQDPQFPWVPPVAGPDGLMPPLARFRVFDNRPGAARVRTATAEIGLPNLINRGL